MLLSCLPDVLGYPEPGEGPVRRDRVTRADRRSPARLAP
jgi:hypothetical protein